MKKRLFAIAVAAVAAGGFSAPAHASVGKCTVVKAGPAVACAYVDDVDPTVAGVNGSDPAGSFDAHLGFDRSPVPSCSPSDVTRGGLPPLPTPVAIPLLDTLRQIVNDVIVSTPPLPDLPELPQLPLPDLPVTPVGCSNAMFSLYEIVAVSDTPSGEMGVRGTGTPAPCTSSCGYIFTVEAGKAGNTVVLACYDVQTLKLSC